MALIGLVLVAVVLIANIVVAGDSATERAETTAWTLGLGTTAFATGKIGIALILIGIMTRLWLRVESVKASLPLLKPEARADGDQVGDIDTPYGPATATRTAPKPLFIHNMAPRGCRCS